MPAQKQKKKTTSKNGSSSARSGGGSARSGSSRGNSRSKSAKSSKGRSSGTRLKAPNPAAVAWGAGLLFILSILTAACVFFPGVMGGLGRNIHNFLFSLFGSGACFLPFFVFVGALFFRKDMEEHAVGLKILFGFLAMAFIGVLCHCLYRNDPVFADLEGAAEHISAWYREGAYGVGGGLIGGFFAWILGFIGIVGTLIVSIPALVLLLIFYIGMTPHSLIITLQYYYYKQKEHRDAVREAAAPSREARQAELERRQAELAEMRAAQAERQRQIREQRAAEAEVRRSERQQNRIDSNIYTDEEAEKLPPDPIDHVDYDTSDAPQTSAPERPKHQVRAGAPVPGEVYDRGDTLGRGEQPPTPPPVRRSVRPETVMPGTAASVTTAAAAAKETAAPVPDAAAYSLAEQDEARSLADGTGSSAGGKADEQVLHAEDTRKAPEITPTAELDLNEIFSSPSDASLLKRYGPAAAGGRNTDDPLRAEVELNVTRVTPEGLTKPEDEPEPSADRFTDEEESPVLPPLPMDPPEELVTSREDEDATELNDDAAALLRSLNAFYGTEQEDTEQPPEPVQTETVPPAPGVPGPVAVFHPDEPQYIFPPVTLLKKDTSQINEDLSEELEEKGELLVSILRSFNVKTNIVNVSRGPTITRYELQPEAGTRVRSVTNLVDDIALGMAASGVRIEAPIPGKNAIGIEVPNQTVSTVYIRDLIECDAFRMAKSRLTTCLGMDVAGAPVYLDVAKMPHLLICGATGMGKSVCINSLIVSMLYKATPDEVKLILIDPKKVELNIYSGIPHLLVPVVSDPKKAAGALHWAVTEMERRFELIEDVGMRDIKGYNEVTKNDPDREHMSHIVIIIDELADLMMTAPDDVEDNICRIAQKARAAGMHLIIGTQRPSVDVVTGLIKANIPSRIAFRVSSQMDSRVVLDAIGAEKLIGRGDMLYAPVGASKPQRVQGAFVSEDEIEQIIMFLKKTAGHAEYADDVMESIEREAALCGQKKGAKGPDDGDMEDDGPDDPMLKSAIELAVESGKISTSLIQRRLSLGYGRAAKLIDRMEQLGYVSAPEGQKPRQVLITKEQFMELVMNKEGF
ncbi:MAG: DUF87 domain-containing protein [Clostridia bacterium]|nr:DUF87 domain-containing protein [Clostridia bacterium]